MKPVLRFIAHIHITWQECYWGFVITWRDFHGRWYIFRDVPTRIVEVIAEESAEHFAHLASEARDELRLRKVTLSTKEGTS